MWVSRAFGADSRRQWGSGFSSSQEGAKRSEHDALLATLPDPDQPELHMKKSLDALHESPGVGWQVVPMGGTAGGGLPAGELLINWTTPFEQLGASWQLLDALAVEVVGDADLDERQV